MWLDFSTNCTYLEALALAESGDAKIDCCIGDFVLPGSKTPTRASGGGTEDVSAWETMYFPANLGINMLYTTTLLETEPATRAWL